MSKIIHLDKTLSNQISAGEVIERPVSIVKELVENSLDAGATNIKVEIQNGGISQVIITDNGEGIKKDEISLALDKYSTSKISSLEDLYNVMTFGFRGEALSSVSSVSRFQIISKNKNSNSSSSAWSIEVIDGEKSDLLESSGDIGTKIIVKDLFYNTPARLNYLKKPRTEYSHILSFLHGASLSYPCVGFEFINDGKKVFQFKSDEDLKTRIYNIYGEEFSENLLDINSDITGVNISGYISDCKVSFPNRNRQVLFVNKRIVKSSLIYKAISSAYNRFIPHSNFPAYVLNIDVDPTQVDVNVHPRKLEVRFAQESHIFRGIFHAIEDKLKGVSLISNTSARSSVFPLEKEEINNNSSYYTGSGTKFKSYSPYKNTKPNPSQGKISDAIVFSRAMISSTQGAGLRDSFEQSSDLHDTPVGKIIGQTFNSYIIVETPRSLKILDQHALAERVLYEKLVKGQHKANTQGLLIGESLNLSPKEIDILNQNKEIFFEMGFDFEIMDSGIIMINGIPDFIKKENIENIFLGIISDIGEHKFSKSNTLEEVKNKIFAYAACRGSIKFGNKLNLFEMNKLLCDSALDYSSTCPHGRPVVYEISLDEMKDKYER